MALDIQRREKEGITILDLKGRLVVGDASLLREKVNEEAASGKTNVILNLADVDYIDSSGIGELVGAYTTVRGASGELKLVYLTKRVRDIIQITRLFTVFDVQPDEASAVRSFQ